MEIMKWINNNQGVILLITVLIISWYGWETRKLRIISHLQAQLKTLPSIITNLKNELIQTSFVNLNFPADIETEINDIKEDIKIAEKYIKDGIEKKATLKITHGTIIFSNLNDASKVIEHNKKSIKKHELLIKYHQMETKLVNELLKT